MKLTGARLRGFLARPADTVRVALVCGPDRGLVRERIQQLIAAVAGAPPDPFRLAELAADAVKADPLRLADEALALPFGGGRRLVLVHEASDVLTAAVRAILALPDGTPSLTVLEAAELSKRSTLRQLCEEDDAAVAIVCYEDDEEALRQVIREALAADGLEPSPAALDYLQHSLGVDRAVTRGELAKLATYMGAGQPADGRRRVELADARAVIDDGHGASLGAIAFATADGDGRELDRLLEAAWREGLSPVALLRATANHLQRLLAVRALIAAGRSEAQAMASLKPPVLFFQQQAFRRQLARWPEARLGQGLSRLLEAELACKSGGGPQRLLCARALVDVAGLMAARGRGR